MMMLHECVIILLTVMSVEVIMKHALCVYVSTPKSSLSLVKHEFLYIDAQIISYFSGSGKALEKE